MATFNNNQGRAKDVGLCQDVDALRSIDVFDYQYMNPAFRDYLKARIGFSGMQHSDGRAMTPGEVATELRADPARWNLLRAQIQDCWNIFRGIGRPYLKPLSGN